MVLPYKYVIVAHLLNKTARKTKTLAYIRHTQLGFIIMIHSLYTIPVAKGEALLVDNQ